MFKKYLLSLSALFLLAGSLLAGEFRFFGTTDKDPLQYAAGEEMTFSVQLLEDDKPVSGKRLKWTRRGDDGITFSGEAVSDAIKPLEIKTKIEIPGFVHVMVQGYDESGNILKNGEKNMPSFDGGAGVRLNEITGCEEPADFD
ncbi:MAG: acetylxylan esterase, partial [Planctomycetia bacterium]|nr:acetylxylan esterase [Planctomycetia bacterium]